MKIFGFLAVIFLALTSQAQTFEREFPVAQTTTLKITNLYGRVSISVDDSNNQTVEAPAIPENSKVILSASNSKENDLKITSGSKRIEITVQPEISRTRIDLTLKVPPQIKLNVTTADGEVRLEGNVESAEVKTETGTIAANIPLDDVKYDFVWTESRPRFLSDVELEEANEKAAGKFVINGRLSEKLVDKKKVKSENEEISDVNVANEDALLPEKNTSLSEQEKKAEIKNKKPKSIKLNFTTARGIILLNVNPNEVPSNLTERPLTEAAKAIIRSGDSLLAEAVRRASPKYFGEYAKTLPPRKSLPTLTENKNTRVKTNNTTKKVLARVTDFNNRAIGELKKDDFELTEAGEIREIVSIEPTTAPFNLVLLLDVSGSVDNYVDFIRKTARNFVNTVGTSDRISIIIFNEDVKTLSTFTTDKGKLSESLDTFDAGGGTAFYDALAFSLADTLRPLKGERTAIVILSDGDDNRSFLPFDSLVGAIQESGALIYPLYVPSELIAASANNNATVSVDPLRSRYLALTSKAESEGAKLAQISGGVYYPISQIGDLQKAYNDIVIQLRTAYLITFRSNVLETTENRSVPRLRVRVKRENSLVRLGSTVEVADNQ